MRKKQELYITKHMAGNGSWSFRTGALESKQTCLPVRAGVRLSHRLKFPEAPSDPPLTAGVVTVLASEGFCEARMIPVQEA